MNAETEVLNEKFSISSLTFLIVLCSVRNSFSSAFSILFYPVITAEKGKAHQGSFNALLGDKRNAETDTWYSLQNRVSSETPPTLLLLSDDDRVVPPVNSTLYYNALKDNGVKASMHIYPTGGHGWGIRKNFKYAEYSADGTRSCREYDGPGRVCHVR